MLPSWDARHKINVIADLLYGTIYEAITFGTPIKKLFCVRATLSSGRVIKFLTLALRLYKYMRCA